MELLFVNERKTVGAKANNTLTIASLYNNNKLHLIYESFENALPL